MSSDSAPSGGERPLANPGPILVVAGIGIICVVGLVLSLFRDPGLPAYVEESYMRVAGSLVTVDYPVRNALGLAATLSQAAPGSVRVPALDSQGYDLDGGTHVTLGGAPAALAIYHNTLRDLVVWHGVTASIEELPPAPDLRVVAGRRYYVHYKASTTIAFWQEGPILMSITSALPAEQVMAIAVAASAARP